MGFKTLTIKEEVYRKLAARKNEGESFSKFLDRLADKEKPDLMKFAGAWKNIPDEEIEKLRKEFRGSFNESFQASLERSKRLWKNEGPW